MKCNSMKWLIIKLKNPIKTCVSDCVDCFTGMLSRCSKHSKLSHIFLVMRRTHKQTHSPHSKSIKIVSKSGWWTKWGLHRSSAAPFLNHWDSDLNGLLQKKPTPKYLNLNIIWIILYICTKNWMLPKHVNPDIRYRIQYLVAIDQLVQNLCPQSWKSLKCFI